MANKQTLPQIVCRIQQLEKHSIKDATEIGRLLEEAREHLEHGEYQSWLKQEFSWSYRTALRYQRLHHFKSDTRGTFDKLNISLTALHFVADPGTSEAARKAIIRAALKGRVTHSIAKAITAELVPDDPPPPPDPIGPTDPIEDGAEEPSTEPSRDKVGKALRDLVACVDQDWTEGTKTLTPVKLRQIISLLEAAYTARIGGDAVKARADRAEAKSLATHQ